MQNKGECFFQIKHIPVSAISKTLIWLLFLGGSKKIIAPVLYILDLFLEGRIASGKIITYGIRGGTIFFYNICKKTGEIVVAALRRGEKFEEDMG